MSRIPTVNPFGAFSPSNIAKRHPLPSGRRDWGIIVAIIGLGWMIGAGIDPAQDLCARSVGQTAPAHFVSLTQRIHDPHGTGIGAYIFKDVDQTPHLVMGRKFYAEKPTKPKLAAWPKGQPELAKIVGEFDGNWPYVGVGALIFAFGLYLRKKP